MVTWNESKRRASLSKHGMDLADAAGFDFASADIEEDRDARDEQRFRATGDIGTRVFSPMATTKNRTRSACGQQPRKRYADMQKDDSPLTKAELKEIARRRAANKKRALAYADNISPEEEARIVAAAESDPDAQPMTDEQLARMRPAHEVLPGLVAKQLRDKGGRPRSPAPKKLTTVRIDPDVLDFLKRDGKGWQTRMNAILRHAMARAARKRA